MEVNKPKWKDYGNSSLTLLAVHSYMDIDNPSIPYDPSDFRRCVHLFECLEFGNGEIMSLLAKASDKYSIWLPFAEHWDYLMELYEEEKNQREAPKLYRVIQRLVEIAMTKNSPEN